MDVLIFNETVTIAGGRYAMEVDFRTGHLSQSSDSIQRNFRCVSHDKREFSPNLLKLQSAVIDTNNNLMWQDNEEVETNGQDWQSAINYCENLELDGSTNWRLPNVNEAHTIIEEFSSNASPVFAHRSPGYEPYWWTSSTLSKNSVSTEDEWAWSFYAYPGRSNHSQRRKSRSLFVRCVRDFTRPVSIAGNDQTVTAFESVTLDGSASYDPDGSILNYSWIDHTTNEILGNEAIFSKNDFSVGQHEISLIVTDNNGLRSNSTYSGDYITREAKLLITVEPSPLNNPPVVDAGSDQTVSIGVSVVFDASNSSDSDGAITAYEWKEGNEVLSTVIQFEKNDFSLGQHVITLTVTDDQGASAVDNVIITVTLIADTTPPVIAINGENTVSIKQGATYTDAGATALDDRDGAVDVITTGTVDTSTLGTYTITYSATDLAGNSASATRTVNVVFENSALIEVISPLAESQIEYSYITLQVKNTVSDVKVKNLSLTNPVEQAGVKSGTTFLIYNVLLQLGENRIEISANGGSEKTILTLNSEGKGPAPVLLELEQTKAFGSLTSNATVKHASLVVTQYLIDTDGDKVIDIESTSATHQLNFPAVGAYRPRAIVKTVNNLLYASSERYNETVNILDNPEVQSTVVPGISNEIHDLEEFGSFIYALTDSTIIKISKNDHTQIETINLANFSSPRGFTLDNEGNLFIADTGADRVVKLLASNSYQPDPTFVLNTGGSGDGELLSPMDITLSNQGTQLKVFVLDAGNNRIQIFNFLSAYIDQFDGSTTPQGKLNNPLNMIGAPTLIITDTDNNSVREISYNSQSNTLEGKQLLSLNAMGKVTFSSDGLLVSDKDSKQLLYLQSDGTILNRLPLSQTIKIAMGYERNHQLLYLAQSSTELKHLYIPKTAANGSPTALSQKFVQSYLAGNDQDILEFTPKRLLDRLRIHDAKAQEAFSNMVSYKENIYLYGENAVVEGRTQISTGEVIIKFYFVWRGGRWILNRVL